MTRGELGPYGVSPQGTVLECPRFVSRTTQPNASNPKSTLLKWGLSSARVLIWGHWDPEMLHSLPKGQAWHSTKASTYRAHPLAGSLAGLPNPSSHQSWEQTVSWYRHVGSHPAVLGRALNVGLKRNHLQRDARAPLSHPLKVATGLRVGASAHSFPSCLIVNIYTHIFKSHSVL